jgi:selenide,water dikinase
VQVLSGLPAQTDPRLLVGTSTFDDAGVALVSPELALVQTVDFFPPVVDDPWWYGRIAAANALSDIYAMGATPFSALNLVAFPTSELPLSVLGTILQGGGDAVREAGAMMLGGHSIVDTGIKFGLAVTGTVAPGKQVTNAGAQAGDVLYLTKPLGTGCLTTGARKQQVDEAVMQAAMESMGRLNKAACEAMVAVGVNAATDVTGYGLIGHAAEMAEGSGVELVLEAGSLPLLAGAEAAMRAGLGSGGAGRTLKHLGPRLAVEGGVDESFQRLAADSETSGGLLIAVPPAREAALRQALEERGVLAQRIGAARARSGAVAIRLVR